MLWMLLSLVACSVDTPEAPPPLDPTGPVEPTPSPVPDGAVPLATRVPASVSWPVVPEREPPLDSAAMVRRSCYVPPPTTARPMPRNPAPAAPRAGSGSGMGINSLSTAKGSGSTRSRDASGSSAGDGFVGGAPMADAEPRKAEAPREQVPAAAPMADPDPMSIASSERLEAPPDQDWGATIYLSNDDSMSLASAQRLLWAVEQGRTPKPGEVRPHELLNYFSFDTVPVAEGQTFTALGVAEQQDDTLSVALAVQGAKPPRQPLDLSLVIDRSGSMAAEGRMAYVKRGLMLLVEQLTPGDRVDLTLFDSSVCSPIENFVVGRDDVTMLKAEIARIQPRGATDLDAGLRQAYALQQAHTPESTHGKNRRVLLLTDAQLNQGNVDEDLVSEVGKRLEDDGIRVTGIGVGRDFNDTMLDKLTEKGKGAYVYLGSEAVVDRVFSSGFDALVQTIAHDVQFSVELPDSLAMERFYGEEASTDPTEVQPIHYFAGTSQVFLQDLRIKPGALSPTDPLMFHITWRDAITGEPKEQRFHTTIGALLEGDPHNLHKAQALMRWTDVLAARAMGAPGCEGVDAYRTAAAKLFDDAEIRYISTLTDGLCGLAPPPPLPGTTAALKVTVDADMPVSEVRLSCGDTSLVKRLSINVAHFESARVGTCELTVMGKVPMQQTVQVPSTGTDVRCLVRAGRMNCS